MEKIIHLQQHLSSQGTSIDTLIVLTLALLALFVVAYLIELDNSKVNS